MRPIILLIFIFNTISGFSQQSVKPFIPDILKQFPNVRDIAISPNGKEMMFSAQSIMGNLSAIITIKKEGNTWTTPQVASFSGQYFDLEPFFSNDGLKIYFVSTRPLSKSSNKPKDFDIWYSERTTLNSNWSQPINMGSPINTEHGEFYPSIANNGNFYFTRDNPKLKRKDDIYMSTFSNGIYTKPKMLPDTINTVGYEYNAFIAPDESYLIYGCYNKEGGYGSGDLYISYHNNNEWSEAKNLGETINTKKMDYCPFVDNRTNTLYFTSKQDNTQTDFENPLSINTLLKAFNRYDNGLSRLYKIPISELPKK
ncbi:hypothetical protein Q4Q34_19135 [Flavivirga abyssicola]|uniref:hypothetical protein n=1 Tax=Flavivirga abyssicola TaxID=3063533 RepID=UPI0026DFBF86|nr:hypothetical protein [Flavivirga sp. MEBiC07777]WVK13330.1 hypothetical protein Q4Q34_19135 [Flavivirga sp. MEBiC07777]